MTSCALAPNLLTHLGHGRSPVCAASLRPNPCRMGSLRNLLGLQYGLLPSSGAKCTHGRWVFVGRDCMDHAIPVRRGISLTGSSRRCLKTPTDSRGMHYGSSASVAGPCTLNSSVSQRSRHLTDVTTSRGGHIISRRSRRLTDVMTSHGGHDVSRRSRRLTYDTTSHGCQDVSWRSRSLTEPTTSTTSHGGHDVSRTSRSLKEVTTSRTSRRSRRLMEVTIILHCLVVVGTSSTEQSGHHQVLGLKT